jgi:hypothetical protein
MDDNMECPRCHNIFPKQNQIMHDARCTVENPMALDQSRKIQLNEINKNIEEMKIDDNSPPKKEKQPEVIPKNQNQNNQNNQEFQPPLQKISDSGEFPSIFVCEKCGETLPESERKDHMLCHNLENEERNRLNDLNNEFHVSEREIEKQKQIEKMIKKENDLRRQMQNQNQNQRTTQQNQNQRTNSSRAINQNNFFNNDNILSESDMQFFGNMGFPGMPRRTNTQNNQQGHTVIRIVNNGPNGQTVIRQQYGGNSGQMGNMMDPMMDDPFNMMFDGPSGRGIRQRRRIPFSNLGGFDAMFEDLMRRLGSYEHPTDEQIINELPETQIDDVTKLDPEKKNCIICLEDFKNGDKATVLPCIHLFHTTCIQNWLKTQNTCPICKYKLTGENLNDQR